MPEEKGSWQSLFGGIMAGEDCNQIRRLLDGFLEGELTPERATAVKRHISDCPFCRQELLERKRAFSRIKLDPSPQPSGDWLDLLGKKLSPDGLWQELLRGMFLPLEKKIPLLAAALVLIAATIICLRLIGCEVKRGKEFRAEPPPPVPSPTGRPLAGESPVASRLRKSPLSTVLVVDEPALSGESSAPSSLEKDGGDHPPFQDLQVKLYVENVASALQESVQLALGAGGQRIDYPIKGFENMGPHEQTLVFPLANFHSFLDRLQTRGRIEYPPLIHSDYVTVRLTVLAPYSSPPPPPGSARSP